MEVVENGLEGTQVQAGGCVQGGGGAASRGQAAGEIALLSVFL
jgi:hypothetical protein